MMTELIDNAPGAAARAKRNEVNAKSPRLNLLARMLGIHTDERAWRVGAKGEEKVGKELAKLGPEWHVLHAVEVGDRGSDIDHVVIGPAGVITLNTKRHPGAKAWVGDRMIMINGQKSQYLRNSRFEAQRASKLLTSACGFPVQARAAIVLVDLDDIKVKQMPTDVHVVSRRRVRSWLVSLPATMNSTTAESVFAAASNASTWRAEAGSALTDDRRSE